MISIILLTYNRQKLLGRAIESIKNQSFTDYELIIVDNGSTDESGKIAEKYAARDDRIKTVRRSRGNIGSGRNTGLDAAAGDYIAFVDDDDYVEPDFLEFLYKLAVNHSADISICGAAGREFDEKFVMNPQEALIRMFWRKYYNIQFPTKLIRSSLFENARFSEDVVYDDIELCPFIMAGAKRIAYHGLAKYTFDRGHGGNNSAWTSNHRLLTSRTLDEYLRVFGKRTDWLCERFPENSRIWRYFEWSFMISMIDKITRYSLKDCYVQRTELAGIIRQNRSEFLNSEYILDFEKEWVKQYV